MLPWAVEKLQVELHNPIITSNNRVSCSAKWKPNEGI